MILVLGHTVNIKAKKLGGEVKLRHWIVKFIVNSYTYFTEKIIISDISFFREGEINYAGVKVDANSQEEAEKIAYDRITNVVQAMSLLLKQEFKVAIISTHEFNSPSSKQGSYCIRGCVDIVNPFPIEVLTEVQTIESLARKDSKVKKVIRLMNFSDAYSWVNLYRICEIITDDIDIVKEGWISKRKLKLFKRTACSPTCIGREARHGIPVGDPPRKPMEHEDAKQIIYSIIKSWIENKDNYKSKEGGNNQ